MQKLGTFYDHVLEKSYDLYSISLHKLEEIIQQNYPYAIEELHRFNEDLKVKKGDDTWYYSHASYGEILRSVGMYKAGINRRIRDLDEQETLLKNTKKIIEKGEFNKPHDTVFGHFAYEMYPFSVSLNSGDLENGEVELLDGYRRMFFVSPKPDIEVFVKVYPQLSERDWVSAMVMFNSWKFANNDSIKHFFDRGIKLGLYKRHKLDWNSIYYYDTMHIDRLMDAYISRAPYKRLWQNDKLKDDLLLLKEAMVFKPHFLDASKRKSEELNYAAMSNEEYTQNYPDMMDIFLKKLASLLGEFRRDELNLIQSGDISERRTIVLEDIQGVFTNEDLQKDYIRMCKMTVNGHIENRFDDTVFPVLKSAIYNT